MEAFLICFFLAFFACRREEFKCCGVFEGESEKKGEGAWDGMGGCAA